MELPVSVLSEVASVLEKFGIRYVLVGSFASSVHGIYRSTADIDILADVKVDQLRPLVDELQPSFYVDEFAARDAVAHGSSFNAIHFDSVFKVDIFISWDNEFAQSQLERGQLRTIPGTGDKVVVATAEDTVLAKLNWDKAGNEVSNNHWNDVVGILGIAGSKLDLEYLQAWASELEVTTLLEKAFDEAR